MIFIILVYDVFVIIVTLCPSRFSNPIDIAKCVTVACVYLEFHLIDCYCSSMAYQGNIHNTAIYNAYCAVLYTVTAQATASRSSADHAAFK